MFYGAILGIGGYTAAFSIALWRQFFAPLSSIWVELESKSYCNCCCMTMTQCGVACRRTSCTKRCHRCCDCLTEYIPSSISCLSPHAIIYILSAIYVLVGVMERDIDAVPPIGICLIGTRTEAKTWRYHIIPESLFLFLSALFLGPALLLLLRFARKNSDINQATKREFRHLQWRLLAFFLCILTAWSFVVATILFIFQLGRPQYKEAAAERITCMIFRGGQDVEDCLYGYHFKPGYYSMVALSMPIAGLGSLLMSCNTKNVKRWKLIVGACCCMCCCRGKDDASSVVWEKQPSFMKRMGSVRDDASSNTPKSKLEVPPSSPQSQCQSTTASPSSLPVVELVADDSALGGTGFELR